jgi:hypothetical protein
MLHETQFKQLAVDPGSTPQRIGLAQVANEPNGVWANGVAAGFAGTAFPSPEEPKALPTPADDGIGLREA